MHQLSLGKILSLLTLACLVANTQAQVSSAQRPVRVGIVEQPPLAYSSLDSVYDGLAVQLWEAIAERADLRYDYVVVQSEDAEDELRRGDIDVYLTSTTELSCSDSLQYSPIYFSSNLGVAAKAGGGMLDVVKGFFKPSFFKIVLGLSILLLIVGIIVYFLERNNNEEQFGGGPLKGIGSGFWWAGVTLTTIGYGDKAPVTLWGRMVAMLWMLIGLAVSATLTAALVSLVNESGKQVQIPKDLRLDKNVVVEGHTLTTYLDRHAIGYDAVQNLQLAFSRVAEDDSTNFVIAYEMELEHHMSEQDGRDLTIHSTRLQPSYFRLAFSPRFASAAALSEEVRQVTLSSAWSDWVDRYAPRQ